MPPTFAANCGGSVELEDASIYSNLTPLADRRRSARHPDGPQTLRLLELIFDEFVELHGDRAFGDDRAIRTGFARLGDYRVMLIGHQKGHTLKERRRVLLRLRHPEGYRKALSKMQLAAKFRLPIICLIDTPGAYPGIGAEERGQAQLIATNLLEMSRLPTPIICVVIGEGGSGGALGIGIGDRVSMLEHAYYSVISPEGCAGILWKEANDETKPLAAEALKLTARDLFGLRVIDDIIPEPLGGAHRDHREMGNTLKAYLLRYLRDLRKRRSRNCWSSATRSSAAWASSRKASLPIPAGADLTGSPSRLSAVSNSTKLPAAVAGGSRSA